MRKLYLLFCFCCCFQQHIISQTNPLVRSTTGASGASNIIVNNDNIYVIQQSLGQASPIGTIYNDNYILRQGFIQPDILAKIKEDKIPLNLQLSLYPNPFVNKISLGFNEEIKGEIKIGVFNVLGSRVFVKNYQANQHIDVELEKLSSGEYIFKAVANNKQFLTKIIKR